VETGRDFQVAKLIHNEAARRAENAPIRAICGSARISVETMPLRIVFVTWEPINTAPVIFRIPAINSKYSAYFFMS